MTWLWPLHWILQRNTRKIRKSHPKPLVCLMYNFVNKLSLLMASKFASATMICRAFWHPCLRYFKVYRRNLDRLVTITVIFDSPKSFHKPYIIFFFINQCTIWLIIYYPVSFSQVSLLAKMESVRCCINHIEFVKTNNICPNTFINPVDHFACIICTYHPCMYLEVKKENLICQLLL